MPAADQPARLGRSKDDVQALGRFLDEVDGVTVRSVGEHVIFDIVSEDEDPEDDDWDDDSSQLAALAPLRADLIGGDLWTFCLLWLTAVEDGTLDDATAEPLAGIGPLTASLQAFADFVRIDPDLVRAPAEREATRLAGRTVEAAVAALPDGAKISLLLQFFNADPHAGAALHLALRGHWRPETAAAFPPPRTVGTLRARAEALRLDRARAKAATVAAQRRREAAEAEKQRRVCLDALMSRGDAVGGEIETEIGRRNGAGYAKAAAALSDLKVLAAERGLVADFDTRLPPSESGMPKRAFHRTPGGRALGGSAGSLPGHAAIGPRRPDQARSALAIQV